MDQFSRVAFHETAWRALYGTAAALVLMLCYSANPPAALLLGAHVALLFAVGMLVYALQLTDDRIELSEPWLALEPGERPEGTLGRQRARNYFAAVMLRFAKGGAAIAAALAGLAVLLRA